MLADILSLVPAAEDSENSDSGGTDTPQAAGTSRRSLLHQVKLTKEAFVRAFHAMHDEVSSSVLPAIPAVGSVDIEASANSIAAAAVTPPLDSRLSVQLPETGGQHDSQSCGDNAVVSLLSIRVVSGGSGSVETIAAVTTVLNSAVVTTLAVAGELYVLCSEDQSVLQTHQQSCGIEEKSALRQLSARVVYAARLALNGSVISSNVMRLRLYIAPPPTTTQLPHISRVSSPEEDDNSSDGSCPSSSRVTAVVGLTAASSSSSAVTGLGNVCFFRIDIKDLQFTAVETNISVCSDNLLDVGLLRTLPMHTCVNNRLISGSISNSTIIPVPVRHRLLELDIPVLASQNLILEVSPARGIAVVGSPPTPELDRGTKLIVLDVENDEEDVDDDDDNDEDAMES